MRKTKKVTQVGKVIAEKAQATDVVFERIAMALEAIARDVKRFVQVEDRCETEGKNVYPTCDDAPTESESRVIRKMLKGDAP
mgnify:CR=1 FL=1